MPMLMLVNVIKLVEFKGMKFESLIIERLGKETYTWTSTRGNKFKSVRNWSKKANCCIDLSSNELY